MMHSLIALTIVVVILIVLARAVYRPKTTRCEVAGVAVNVIGDFENAEDARKLMALLDSRMMTFLAALRKDYRIGATDAESGVGGVVATDASGAADVDERKIISALLRGFNYEEIHEEPPGNGEEVAYSVDKGKSIHLCLRNNKLPLKLIDINVLMFVLLHECAHIASYDVWGHPARFWSVFKALLVRAQNAGVYEPEDYARRPVDYCGFHLAHNPLFDAEIIPAF